MSSLYPNISHIKIHSAQISISKSGKEYKWTKIKLLIDKLQIIARIKKTVRTCILMIFKQLNN